MPETQYDLTVALTRYEPYVSGMAQTARSIAEGMANRGWRVAVVAAQHDPALPLRDTIGGVEVYRAPLLTKTDRAVVAPRFTLLAARLARHSSVLHLHLPVAGAGLLTALCGHTPVVSILDGDRHLAPDRLGRALGRASNLTARAAIRCSAAVVATSSDQVRGSRFWPVMQERDVIPITPPCLDRRGGRPRYRETTDLHVGFLGRIAEDKGVEYLVRAFQRIAAPSARLLIAGDYTGAGGGNLASVQAAIDQDNRIRILGELRGREVDDLYASIDVFAAPTVTCSFGIGLAEAIMCGVPSVTTDLPGARYPITSTGFGQLVPPRDTAALARAILYLAGAPREWRDHKAKAARARFCVAASLDAHEVLFTSLVHAHRAARMAPAATEGSTDERTTARLSDHPELQLRQHYR